MLARTGFKRKVYDRAPASKACPLVRRVSLGCSTIVATPSPKQPRYADRHLLDLARGQDCLLSSPLCNHDPATTVACHGSGLENGKGLGYKTSDALSCWGCSDCNHYTDAYSGATPEEKRTVFAAGHARQVKIWYELANNEHASKRDRASAQGALDQLKTLAT